MRYTYDFKLRCVEMYKEGIYYETPAGVSTNQFRKTIRNWSYLFDTFGPETLENNRTQTTLSTEEKYILVSRILDGGPLRKTAKEAGVSHSALIQWVKRYKLGGYEGLADKPRGRPQQEPEMTKNNDIYSGNESEHEELLRLREEIEYLKTENAYIKKLIALSREKKAAQLKVKKQPSSKDSGNRDSN